RGVASSVSLRVVRPVVVLRIPLGTLSPYFPLTDHRRVCSAHCESNLCEREVVFSPKWLDRSRQRDVQRAIAMLLWQCRLRPKALAWQRDHDDKFSPGFIRIELKIRHLGVSARMGTDCRR